MAHYRDFSTRVPRHTRLAAGVMDDNRTRKEPLRHFRLERRELLRIPYNRLELDGSSWTQIESQHPKARHATVAAPFPPEDEVVLFGGNTWDNVFLGDTWTSHGSTWIEPSLAKSPAPRSAACIAFLP